MNEKSGYRNGQLIYPISVLDTKPQEGGGGGGGLGPHTVGHEELKTDSVDTDNIVDGSVQEQDLHDDVKDRMTITYDDEDEGIRFGGYAKPGDLPSSNMQNVSTAESGHSSPIVVEEEEEP